MAASVALSAAAAALVLTIGPLQSALFGPSGLTAVGWVVTFAPLALVIIIGAGAERLSGAAARALLALYAMLFGLSVGVLFIGLTGSSIVATFLIAASAFAVLGTIGLTTRRDLSGLGSFLTIVLVGLIVAMLVNLFLRSARLDLGVAAVGVLLFAGLTAYDTQRLKRLYDERMPTSDSATTSLGALTLYLDFLNLFLSLLRFTGRRR
ncbi:Bax inhibitor-1/YccA family protein [Sphingomonas pollutisoli]|uniref:Bax inhibitor-1/YccA family protein n=1 Tax=Sphingomonas pollutisoli TaxID=3030829 RepID=UPI003B831558